MISFKSKWRGMLRQRSAELCKLCAYLFVPQMGRQRRRMEQLKRGITYIIGNERAEGNLSPITPKYVSRMLNVPLADVQAAMREMEL